jgi:hypothetical protein
MRWSRPGETAPGGGAGVGGTVELRHFMPVADEKRFGTALPLGHTCSDAATVLVSAQVLGAHGRPPVPRGAPPARAAASPVQLVSRLLRFDPELPRGRVWLPGVTVGARGAAPSGGLRVHRASRPA